MVPNIWMPVAPTGVPAEFDAPPFDAQPATRHAMSAKKTAETSDFKRVLRFGY